MRTLTPEDLESDGRAGGLDTATGMAHRVLSLQSLMFRRMSFNSMEVPLERWCPLGNQDSEGEALTQQVEKWSPLS